MPKVVDIPTFTHDILSKALQLFAQKGYRGVSMRLLSKELGVTTGTLYHYFENKEDLYGQMLEKLAQQDSSNLFETLTQGSSPEQFIGYLQAREAYFKQIIFLMFDHQRFVADPSNQVSDAFRQVFVAPIEIYEKALAEQLLMSQDAAHTLLTFLIGSFTRCILLGGAPDFSALPTLIKTLKGEPHAETP